MGEETTPEIKEEAKEETKEAPKVETSSMIDKANEAAERLEKANKEQAELLRQQQDLFARRTLGGQSEAGMIPAAPKELTDTEYAEAFRKGEITYNI
jgi:hypothetical protein